ncbi:MAG TPA: DUF938 domain-containing protein [Reyranellaceae bacterium]|nr:DUF938 domain-containing protein [Reyranellaceae bacterium]
MRRKAAAASRNRTAILDVLKDHLPARGLVLEVASGSGTHVTHFAQALPALTFQPSDSEDAERASIDAWIAELRLPNVRPALVLDAASATWPVERADAVICINMIHIAPWSAAEGLVRGAGRILPAGGILYLYGPYRRQGTHTAPSNEVFDGDLRRRNPAWGVRNIEAVAELAGAAGFGGPVVVPMPSNNFSLVFRR